MLAPTDASLLDDDVWGVVWGIATAVFADGAIQTTGTAVTNILPPVSRFAPANGHGERKARVLSRLAAFLDRAIGLGNSG